MYLISVSGAVGASIGPLFIRFATVRTLLCLGYLMMALCLVLVVVFDSLPGQSYSLAELISMVVLELVF